MWQEEATSLPLGKRPTSHERYLRREPERSQAGGDGWLSQQTTSPCLDGRYPDGYNLIVFMCYAHQQYGRLVLDRRSGVKSEMKSTPGKSGPPCSHWGGLMTVRKTGPRTHPLSVPASSMDRVRHSEMTRFQISSDPIQIVHPVSPQGR